MQFASAREAAAFYLSIGLRPIPLHGVRADLSCTCGSTECNAGKHEKAELDGLWKEGHDFGPADFGDGDNIAVALGPWGGSEQWLVCLDIDGPLDLSLHFYDPLPETLEQKSPRGRHLFFTVQAYAPLGNWIDCLQTKDATNAALDVRYARGKINVHPSRSAFGSYTWGPFREPAELPPSIIEQILERRRDRGLPVLEVWERDGKRP